MKTNIGVFFGGRSTEHEISVISANQAINAMKEICGDHYVSYDMYHVPAMPEKFVNKIKFITV